MAAALPKYITKTKSGYHVRIYVNGEYYAEHFSELKYGKDKALQKAKKKRQEFIKIRESKRKPRPKEYDTRFLYENPDNSTGIIGVFYKEEIGRGGQTYPYYCTTIVAEKDKPKSYSRSIKKWGKGEALLQVCCIRKRHLAATYGDRFDEERFDNSVLNYMEENYLSYREDAMKRLSDCID